MEELRKKAAVEIAFAAYVKAYNRTAKAKGMPLYSIKNQTVSNLGELTRPRKLFYMTEKERADFENTFLVHHIKTIEPLAERGFEIPIQRKAALSKGKKAAGKKRATEKETKRTDIRRVIKSVWKNHTNSNKWSAVRILGHIMRSDEQKQYFPNGPPYAKATMARAVKEELATLRKNKAAS